MTRIILAATVLLLSMTAALAKPVWNGPGWYQVAGTVVGLFLRAGPFASKADCKASLPRNDADAFYLCEYHATRPDWESERGEG